jgi:hypothetical protein
MGRYLNSDYIQRITFGRIRPSTATISVTIYDTGDYVVIPHPDDKYLLDYYDSQPLLQSSIVYITLEELHKSVLL